MWKLGCWCWRWWWWWRQLERTASLHQRGEFVSGLKMLQTLAAPLPHPNDKPVSSGDGGTSAVVQHPTLNPALMKVWTFGGSSDPLKVGFPPSAAHRLRFSFFFCFVGRPNWPTVGSASCSWAVEAAPRVYSDFIHSHSQELMADTLVPVGWLLSLDCGGRKFIHILGGLGGGQSDQRLLLVSQLQPYLHRNVSSSKSPPWC